MFICPFCGARPEPEFFFVGESGKTRPEPAEKINDQDWAAYLHEKKNPKGESAEIWRHSTCGEVFLMIRDTLSMSVKESRSLRREAAR